MLDVPAILKDRKGATLIVRTSYGAAHSGKMLNLYDDRITMEGKTKEGARIVIHLALDCIIEVADLGIVDVISNVMDFPNRPPIGMA